MKNEINYDLLGSFKSRYTTTVSIRESRTRTSGLNASDCKCDCLPLPYDCSPKCDCYDCDD